MSLMTKNNSLTQAEKKLKELKEALQVCDTIAWKAQWAQDFTSFSCISEGMDRILEVVGEVEDELKREIDYVDYQVSDYELKLAMFDKENAICVED
jgi:hypothetical protein